MTSLSRFNDFYSVEIFKNICLVVRLMKVKEVFPIFLDSQ